MAQETTGVRYGWECPNCGGTHRKTRVTLFENETFCPCCKFENIRRWPMRGRGSPPKDRATYTIRLSVSSRKLVEARAKREGIPLSEAIERCIVETQGPMGVQTAFRRLSEWSCLLGCEKRNFSHEEGEVFNEIYYMSADRRIIREQALADSNVAKTFLHIERIEKTFGIPSLADDYTKTLCGLLCSTESHAALWAYTLYLIYCEQHREIVIDDWILKFSEGVPTKQALDRAWKHQQVQKSGEGTAHYTLCPEHWPSPVAKPWKKVGGKV